MNPLGGGATATAPGRSQAQACLCDPALFTLKWGDFVYQREYAQKMHYILMPQDKWESGAAGHLAAHPHNWAVHQWIARTQAERLEYQQRASQRVVVEMPDADELTFRVWKDMIEEPYKYGDDITEWLDLDEEVMRGPKRWRAGAYWQKREDEYLAKEWQRVLGLLAKAAWEQQRMYEEQIAAEIAYENAMATRIQALWRGYSTRVRQTWRDCAKCLKHGICVETLDEEHVCRCCYGEAHPVEDDVVTPVEDRDIWGPQT
jgi:hypothetical protein